MLLINPADNTCDMQELREQNRWQRAIFNSATGFAIIAADLNGLITEWSRGAEHIFGWMAADTLGQKMDQFLIAEDRAPAHTEMEMLLALTSGQASDERRYFRKSGEAFWTSSEMRPLRDEEGAHFGFVKIIYERDPKVVEDIKEAQPVQGLEGRYRKVLDSIDVGFCIVEMIFDDAGNAVDYQFLDINPAFERQSGLVKAVGKTMRLLAPGVEIPWLEDLAGVAQTGSSVHYSNGIQGLGGRWFDVHALRVDGIGENHIAILFNDISSRKVLENELLVLTTSLEKQVKERTQELNRIWASTNDLMAVAGFDGYYKQVNPAWARILGWTEKELLSTHYSNFLGVDDQAALEAGMNLLMNGETISDFIDWVPRKDGEKRLISWTAVPDGDIFHIVGRDITDQRQMEEQLRQSQKMEAVGQLTGGLAHDFNNLLMGITGGLEILQSRISQGRFNDMDKYVGLAQEAAKRAAALTHRLLAFSRRQTLAPKPTDAGELIVGMEDLVRRTIGPDISLDVSVDDDLWKTLVDPNQLENALLNLCINSRDAMPDGGSVKIQAANFVLDERNASDFQLRAGDYIELCVSDNGSGMTEDVISKAFDPFFTTKPMGQGTGLGLSMIYGFARQSGGQVRIHSKLGQGTSICVYLPRCHKEAEKINATVKQTQVHQAKAGETVLIVDDEAVVRMLVKDVLQDMRYSVLEAADGLSGLKILESDVHIDLLITDVGLPGGLNGRQMSDKARAVRPDLKVLYITGFAEDGVLESSGTEPGMEIMTKPFSMDVFSERIKSLLAN